MDYIKCLRELAKSDDYQNLFILAKEMGSIQLFENCNNFTYIQKLFLKYLNFYYNLYMDIATGEVGEIVLECNLYSDAYNMWKRDKEKTKDEKNFKPNKTDINPLNTSTWIFKNAPKNKVK